jgi:hypothetical protein
MDRVNVKNGEHSAASLGGVKMWGTKSTRVISVGPIERGCVVHEALRQRPDTHLSITPDYRRLWTIPKQERFQVVVLHNTLSERELEEISQFVRRQWPEARILVIRYGEEFLDDALYDERLMPGANAEMLHAAIDRLADEWRA